VSAWLPAGGMGLMPALRVVARALVRWAMYLRRGGKRIYSDGADVAEHWIPHAILAEAIAVAVGGWRA
jgi:hypothetical protein